MFEDAVHHLIVQPDDGIDPILKTLNGAIKSLDIKMFQFTDPVLIGAVVNAHKRGIKVRVSGAPASSLSKASRPAAPRARQSCRTAARPPCA